MSRRFLFLLSPFSLLPAVRLGSLDESGHDRGRGSQVSYGHRSSAATWSIGMTVATHHRTRVFTAATLLGALALAGCASMGGDSASTLPAPDATAQLRDAQEIGRASCRERVCQYV